ncbi:MAG: DUF4279 domain-containing protein [Thiotrichaceae bacterium]|nr:DUF4279 domain-containing protein [Thiotrichaceae bacterium]
MISEDDDSDKNLYYTMRLLIRHPSIDPKIITTELRLRPFRCCRFGDRRSTPRGNPLKGLWKDSWWTWNNRYRGNRAFFNSVDELLDRLEPHRAFLLDLVSSGGTISLILHIPGKYNIGNVLNFQSMEKMVNLKIVLGIEVFPDMTDRGGETKIIKPIK